MPKPSSKPLLAAAALAMAPLLLSGCEKPDNAPGPGGVSMGEARKLDEAAEKIEGQMVRVPEPATPERSAPREPAPSPEGD